MRQRRAIGHQRQPVGEGRVVVAEHIRREIVEADPAQPRGHAIEAVRDHLVGQADRLEDLRRTVAIDRRDAHLRHDLEQALLQRVGVVLLGLVRKLRPRYVVFSLLIALLGSVALDRQPPHGRQGQIGVDRLGAHAHQAGQMMHLARLAALDDQADAGALTQPDQVLMNRAERQQRRDRRVGLIHAAVADDQNDLAGGHRLLGPAAQVVERRAHAVGAGGGREQRPQRHTGKGRVAQPTDRLDMLVGQHRAGEPQQVRVARRLLQQMAAPAQRERQRHHQLLGGVAEGVLQLADQRRLRLARGRRLGRIRLDDMRRTGRREHLHLALEPGGVGPPRRQRVLDRRVLLEATRAQVDRDHLAGADLALTHDPRLVHRDRADFRAAHHQAVVGQQETRRAQAITIERQAGHLPIAEGQRGRAVPGLHQAGVELIERAPVGVHIRYTLPGLRHQHRERMADVAPAQHQQFQRIVELGRVAAAHIDQRPQLGNRARQRRAAVADRRSRMWDRSCICAGRSTILVAAPLRLAGAHPGRVAVDGVDLTIVREHMEGLSQLPGREGVGRVALVEDRDRRLEQRVAQVGVELRQERRDEQPLVDDRAAGERGDREAIDAALARQGLDRLARQVERSLVLFRPAGVQLVAVDRGHV